MAGGSIASIDSVTDEITVQVGHTSVPDYSIPSPDGDPTGLTFMYPYLYVCSTVFDRVYTINVDTGDVITYWSGAPNPFGLANDGTNLMVTGNAKIYVMVGDTSSIDFFFSTYTSSTTGLTYDGTNVINCDRNNDKINVYVGKTAAISASYASPSTSPYGLTHDGDNMWSCDTDTDRIYKHVGTTSSIDSFYASPNTVPVGMAYITEPPYIPEVVWI